MKGSTLGLGERYVTSFSLGGRDSEPPAEYAGRIISLLHLSHPLVVDSEGLLGIRITLRPVGRNVISVIGVA